MKSDCSSLTVSPTLTSISMTATSLKSPMSGTRTSMGLDAAAGAGAGATTASPTAAAATDCVAACACSTCAGAAFGSDSAASADSSTTMTEPCLTLSPSATLISLTMPAWLDGISIDALSDSTVMSDCSALTVSPGLTNNSITPTSSKSPMSGTLISTNAIVCLAFLVGRRLIAAATHCAMQCEAVLKSESRWPLMRTGGSLFRY